MARHVVALGVGHYGGTRYGNRHGVGIGEGGARREAADVECAGTDGHRHAVLGFAHEAGNALLDAVVGERAGVGLHLHLVLGIAVRHREGAEPQVYHVVARLRAALQRVSERVVGEAYHGLRACDVIGGALVSRPAIAGDGHGVVGERRAIVRLLGAGARQHHLARVHFEGSRHIIDLELAGNIIALRVEYHSLAPDGHRRGSRVGAAGTGFKARYGKRGIAECECGGLQSFNLLLKAVVERLARVRLDGYLVFGIGFAALDAQLAFGFRQLVVVQARTRVRHDGELV